MYTVPSVSVPGEMHTVDIEVGICTCHISRTGCIWKHQAVVAQLYKLAASNQVPCFSPQLRHLLHCVATGEPTTVKQSFFASLKEDKERTVPHAHLVDDGASEDDAVEGAVGRGHGVMSAADATEDGAVEGAVERGHAVMSAADATEDDAVEGAVGRGHGVMSAADATEDDAVEGAVGRGHGIMSAADATEDGAVEGAVGRGHAVMSAADATEDDAVEGAVVEDMLS